MAEQQSKPTTLKAPEYLWKRLTINGPKPSPRRYCTSISYGNKLYVFGGVNVKKEAVSEMYVFDFGMCFVSAKECEKIAECFIFCLNIHSLLLTITHHLHDRCQHLDSVRSGIRLRGSLTALQSFDGVVQ
jgi:hypothetical protein